MNPTALYSDVSKHVVLYTPLHAHWLPILKLYACRTTIAGHDLKFLTDLVIQFSLGLFLFRGLFTPYFRALFARNLALSAEIISTQLLGQLTGFSEVVVVSELDILVEAGCIRSRGWSERAWNLVRLPAVIEALCNMLETIKRFDELHDGFSLPSMKSKFTQEGILVGLIRVRLVLHVWNLLKLFVTRRLQHRCHHLTLHTI